jgi:branched-chain amino acid transport system substrate-binding protein
MKAKMFFLKLFTVLLLTLVIGLWGCKQKDGEVVIAANIPLTGELAIYGESIRNGVNMAIEEFDNETNQFSFKFDWQDNRGEARNAVSIMQKQLLRPPDIYISGVKPQTMAVIDKIAEKGIPHFVWVFDAFITEEYENVFRTWINYKIEPYHFISYIEKKQPQKIGIIYLNLPHTHEEYKEILIPELKNKGYNDFFVEVFDHTKSDFRQIGAKLKNYEPDIIILSGFKNHLRNMVVTFTEYGIIEDGNTLCTYDLLDAAKDLPVEVLEGLRVVAPTFLLDSSQETKEWKKKFKEKYGKEAKYTDAFAYDMALIIFEALNNLQGEPNNRNIAESLLNVQINGITGELRFDETGDLKTSAALCVYRDGKLVIE